MPPKPSLNYLECAGFARKNVAALRRTKRKEKLQNNTVHAGTRITDLHRQTIVIFSFIYAHNARVFTTQHQAIVLFPSMLEPLEKTWLVMSAYRLDFRSPKCREREREAAREEKINWMTLVGIGAWLFVQNQRGLLPFWKTIASPSKIFSPFCLYTGKLEKYKREVRATARRRRRRLIFYSFASSFFFRKKKKKYPFYLVMTRATVVVHLRPFSGVSRFSPRDDHNARHIECPKTPGLFCIFNRTWKRVYFSKVFQFSHIFFFWIKS